MSEAPIHIKFNNSQNPNAGFDIIRLEELFKRADLDHTPFLPHLVEFYMIILIESGEGVHTIDFLDYPIQKGTVLTIRKDQIHTFHESDSVKGTLLLFTDDFLVTYLEKLEAQKSLQLFNEVLGVPKIQLSFSEELELKALEQRIQNEYFSMNDDYSMGIIRSELHILIAKLFRIKSGKNEILVARKYLNEFIAFQDLVEKNAAKYTMVSDYADIMGLSTKTLNNITKHIVSKSAKAFIDEICTKQIKRLLINTDLSIKEIAYASGFEETTNFYKYFKRQTALTPEQFRGTFR
ncbi:AraC family transcriptional regulator [Lacihabitans lacunae]|uniref:AraC family transcriptional regulator n=1 Tax=Lacihabitans lacunae TaxID=1028214 RepID=A0ABV7Z056_9BACT